MDIDISQPEAPPHINPSDQQPYQNNNPEHYEYDIDNPAADMVEDWPPPFIDNLDIEIDNSVDIERNDYILLPNQDTQPGLSTQHARKRQNHLRALDNNDDERYT